MEWFSKIRADSKEDTVTILKTGVLNINFSAYNKHIKNSKFDRVLFGYDAKTKKAALKPVAADVDGSYPIRTTKRGSSISAKAFLKAFGIEHAETRNYKVEWDNELEALVFKLNK